MAVVRRYIQPANNSAAHISVFGGPLAAGGGGGTEGSPWANWNNMETLVEETGHATDDLLVYAHPAACFLTAGTELDIWDNVGRGTGWASVTIQRWDDKVDANILYEDWYPTMDTHVHVASGSWTGGSISGGVFTPGAGPVFRCVVPGMTGITPGYIRCWGGYMSGDTRATWVRSGVWCYTLADIAVEGDYAQVQNGADQYLYVYSGASGVNPTVRWGSFSYNRGSGGFGTSSVYHRNCRGITWRDWQVVGGAMRFYPLAGGHTTDITFDRFRHRMGAINGITFNGLAGTLTSNIRIYEPDCDAGTNETRIDQGDFTSEMGSQHAVNAQNADLDGLLIRNPKFKGYSHAGVFVCGNPGSAYGGNDAIATSDWMQYPRNVEIEVTDYSDGKSTITGSPNYSRAFAFLVPVNCVVGPLRISKQKVQSQICGEVTIRGVRFDDTCGPFSDPFGSGNYNAGAHMFNQAGPYNSIMTSQKLRFHGMVHDNEGEYAMYWQNTGGVPRTDEILFHGGLIRDDGHPRFRPQSGTAITAAYTRLKTPLLGDDEGSQIPFPQQIRDMMFVLDPACDGIAALKNVSTSQINATTTTHPVVQYNSTGAWGGGRISGNKIGTLEDFGYAKVGGQLIFNGRRRTPYRNGGSSTGRGY
jgi:hypothetical protein